MHTDYELQAHVAHRIDDMKQEMSRIAAAERASARVEQAQPAAPRFRWVPRAVRQFGRPLRA